MLSVVREVFPAQRRHFTTSPVVAARLQQNAGCPCLRGSPSGFLQSVTGDMAMQNKYAEVTPRNFNPMWAPRLSDDARKAVNAAFDAMSTWRIETAKNSVKNSEQVIEKLAAAARALGWPARARKCRASPKCRSKRWIR